jgi:hypothetical protein
MLDILLCYGRNWYIQGRIYSCGVPGEIKIWRPLSVTTYLGYDNFFVTSYGN